MQIGELAAQVGLNPKTIRYYEEIGVLPPPQRTPQAIDCTKPRHLHLDTYLHGWWQHRMIARHRAGGMQRMVCEQAYAIVQRCVLRSETMNLNQITVPSTDVARSIAFYTTLGLRLIVENLPSYARFECPDGDATFSVSLHEHTPTSGGIVVYFECADVDATVTRLQQHGVQFDDAPHDQPWLWREAHLRDLDGNTICLYHAGTNRHNPPWRLSP